MRLVKRIAFCGPLLALLGIVIGLPSVAIGSPGTRDFRAVFLGVNETPSINTEASASLRLRINGSGMGATIDYTLTYSGLRADATQAHIHFAQSKVPGAIVVYLCKTTQTDAPPGTPVCPARAGTVTGTLSSADVTNKAAVQGIAEGDMPGLLKAIRDGAAYGNVHSSMFPAGETRGQLRPAD